MELRGRENSGEYHVSTFVVGLLRGAKVKRRGEGQVGGDGLCGLYVFLLHTEMAFARGEGLRKVFGDEGCRESWSFIKVSTLDCTQKSGRERTESASM